MFHLACRIPYRRSRVCASARSHITFVEGDHEIISTAILLQVKKVISMAAAAESSRVFVSYWLKNVHFCTG